MKTFLCSAPLRFTPGLLAALSILAMPLHTQANVDFELVLWHGYSFYYGDASLDTTNTPATYHRVESPNGLIWQNTGSNNDGSSASLSLTNDLAVLMNEVTNGLWILILNVGDASAQTNAFSVGLSGVTTGLFGNAVVTDPASGSTITTNPPTIMWTGPSQLPSLSINVSLDDFPYTYHDGATLPSTTTSWTPGVTIPTGDQSIFINYRTNNYAGAMISVPTNLVGGAALPGWMANVDISTYAYSGFTVPGAAGNQELGEAVDAPQFAWTTGSDYGGGDWFAQDYEYDTGTNAAQSGSVGDYEDSWIETTIQGPGYLDFYWNMYADYGDYFDLTVSNLYGQYGELSAQGHEAAGWQWYEVYLEPGPNTLRWTFYNDDTDGFDLDAAFLDGVMFYPDDVYYEADFELAIQRVTQGASSYYLLWPSLPYSSPLPFTVNEVVSPNELASGEEYPSSSSHFSTLQDAIDEIEGGDWTIYFDRYGSSVEYYFTIDASALNTNDLPPAIVLDPVDGATGVATNTTLMWLGPTSYDSLYVYARDLEANSSLGGASLPVSSTMWPGAPTFPLGTNSFNATYTSNDYEGLIISYPEDGGSYPLDSWYTQVQLETRAYSTFVAGIGGFVPLPVSILPPMVVGGDLGLSFISQSGATHYIEWSTNLVTGPWMPATNFPGDGTTNMVTLPATNPAAYFKVETQ